MQFHFHANQSHFRKNGFALGLAFETEAQGNSEMAYFADKLQSVFTTKVIKARLLKQWPIYNFHDDSQNDFITPDQKIPPLPFYF